MSIPTFVSGKLDYDDITHSTLATFRQKVASFSATQKAELMALRQTFKKKGKCQISGDLFTVHLHFLAVCRNMQNCLWKGKRPKSKGCLKKMLH